MTCPACNQPTGPDRFLTHWLSHAPAPDWAECEPEGHYIDPDCIECGGEGAPCCEPPDAPPVDPREVMPGWLP